MDISFNPEKELLPGLPSYSGGHMSGGVYNAGEGLNAGLRDGELLRGEINISDDDFRKYLRRFELSGYKIVEEETGKNTCRIRLSDGVRTIYAQKLRAAVLVRVQGGPSGQKADPPTLVRAVTNTTAEAFEAYIKQLEGLGFSVVWQNKIEHNLYLELTGGGRIIYAYFMARTGVARFVDDRVSERIDTFGGGTPLPGNHAAICQFGLYYGLMIHGVTADCGMLYIIKLPDNSLFLIDGGEYEQSTNAAVAEVLRVMRELSGTPEGGKIRIAGWFCTHAHDDHMDLFSKLMRFHHDELELERAIFNFPAQENYMLMPQAYIALDRLKKYYPNVRFLKPHAGQKFELSEVVFEFLQTHEDGVGPLGTEQIGRFNDTSTILKISFGNISFLVLGDMDRAAEAILLSHYTAKTLKSTAVQAAHHLINNLPLAYPVISPDIALVPQHIRKASPDNEKYQTLIKSVAEKDIYFASMGTEIFEEKNGTLVRVRRIPVVGGEYDGSEL